MTMTKQQTAVHKTQHRKPETEQNKPYQKSEVFSDVSEGKSNPVPHLLYHRIHTEAAQRQNEKSSVI